MRGQALVSTLLAGGSLAQSMIRFGCSQLVIERLDPLVSPGALPSPHVHQIVGGNSFNATMDPANHDLVRDSSCTSCTFSEDFSNYWTAVLYFRARNGTFKRVPQFQNVGLRGVGGITGTSLDPIAQKLASLSDGGTSLLYSALRRPHDGDGLQAWLPYARRRCVLADGEGSAAPVISPLLVGRRRPWRRAVHESRHKEPTQGILHRRYPHHHHIPYMLGW